MVIPLHNDNIKEKKDISWILRKYLFVSWVFVGDDRGVKMDGDGNDTVDVEVVVIVIGWTVAEDDDELVCNPFLLFLDGKQPQHVTVSTSGTVEGLEERERVLVLVFVFFAVSGIRDCTAWRYFCIKSKIKEAIYVSIEIVGVLDSVVEDIVVNFNKLWIIDDNCVGEDDEVVKDDFLTSFPYSYNKIIGHNESDSCMLIVLDNSIKGWLYWIEVKEVEGSLLISVVVSLYHKSNHVVIDGWIYPVVGRVTAGIQNSQDELIYPWLCNNGKVEEEVLLGSLEVVVEDTNGILVDEDDTDTVGLLLGRGGLVVPCAEVCLSGKALLFRLFVWEVDIGIWFDVEDAIYDLLLFVVVVVVLLSWI